MEIIIGSDMEMRSCGMGMVPILFSRVGVSDIIVIPFQISRTTL